MTVSRSAALLPHNPRVFLLFVAAELTLAMAVPFLAIKGYHTLLGSQAGVVVAEPEPGTPGWSALVEPTSVVAVAEVFDDRMTGFAIVVVGDDGAASSVVIGSSATVVDGQELSADDPVQAMEQLASALRLRLSSIEVVDDAGWRQAFGAASVAVNNPDPVVDADGQALFEVGYVSVSGEDAAQFLGLPSPGSTDLSLTPRRNELWENLLLTGLAGTGPVAELFPADRAADTAPRRVYELPVAERQADSQQAVDQEASEALLRTLVPFLAGQNGTDRLRVRIVDGHGDADLSQLANQIAARGLEVVEISTASTLLDQPSQLIVPIELSTAVDQAVAQTDALDDLEMLSAELDVEQLITTRSDDQRTVSLVVGPELELAGP